jgi:cAMP-dependent protein kinase regulator
MKTPQQEVAIYEKLNLSFMFRELDEADKKIVVAAMEEKIVIAREKVISEGDEGDCLYVVGSGTLLC